MAFWLKKFLAFWLAPFSMCIIGAVVGLWLTRHKRRATIGRRLSVVSIFVLLIFSNKFVADGLLRSLERRYLPIPELLNGAHIPEKLKNCNFIVVLAAGNAPQPGFSANNLMAASALARGTEGIRLALALRSARLVICGPHSLGTRAIGYMAQNLGISPDRVDYIDGARDTEAEAVAVQSLVNGQNFALVTSAWHMPRAAGLFSRAAAGFVPCPTDYLATSDANLYFDDFLWTPGALSNSTIALREHMGALWNWARGK